jgi:hypothetical protein
MKKTISKGTEIKVLIGRKDGFHFYEGVWKIGAKTARVVSEKAPENYITYNVADSIVVPDNAHNKEIVKECHAITKEFNKVYEELEAKRKALMKKFKK